MKTLKFYSISCLIISFFVMLHGNGYAQGLGNHITMSLENCSQTSPNTIEFDLMVVSDGATNSDLRADAFQFGINYNAGILTPGGAMEINPGNGFKILPTTIPNHIRIASTGFGHGNSGITMVVGQPYLVTKVQLMCSSVWTNNSNPNFTLQDTYDSGGKTQCTSLCYIGTSTWLTAFSETGTADGQRGVSASGSLILSNNITSVAGNNNAGNKTLSCYPNPATQQISFSANGYQGKAQLQVVNMLGQQAITKSVELKGEDYSMDISSLPSGIYKVILMNKAEETTAMFVKE